MITRHEFRRWVRRDELELYVIAHLIEEQSPVLPIQGGPELANFRDLKKAIRDGKLVPEQLGSHSPNVMTTVTKSDFCAFARKMKDPSFLIFARTWEQGDSEQLDTPTHTGAPGRPTSMPGIIAEFEKRILNGLVRPTLTEETNVLRSWFKDNHPTWTVPAEKTIQNKIRYRYKKAKSEGRIIEPQNPTQ